MQRLRDLCMSTGRIKRARSDEEHCNGHVEAAMPIHEIVQRLNRLEYNMNQLIEKLTESNQKPFNNHPSCFTVSFTSGISKGWENEKYGPKKGKTQESNAKRRTATCLQQMVDNVTGIVGMKEAATSKPRILGFIWTILFLFGVSATVYFTYKTFEEYLQQPSATKVVMNGSSMYHFPAMLLCPKHWLDAEKALSMGLSENGLKYSLGYIKSYNGDHENVTASRQQFLDFYNSGNFTSLLHYYHSIAVNLTPVYNDNEFRRQSAGVWLSDSNASCIGKGFQDRIVCYAFEIAPVDLSWSSIMAIKAKHVDNSRGYLPEGNGWWVHVGDDINLLSSVAPGVFLQSFSRNEIMVSARRFIALNRPGGRCAPVAQVGRGYTSDSCIAACQNQVKKTRAGCEMFWLSRADDVGPPSRYCHYTKAPDLKSVALSQPDREECFRKCPESCDQTLHQITLQWQETIPRGNSSSGESYIEVEFDHNAIYDGGLFTLIEVSTYSFADLVTNVGGAFGLFVGGTAMTLAQFVLFFIKYLCNCRNRSQS